MSVMLAARSAGPEAPNPALAGLPDQASFTAAIFGLGGLGVMGLTRLLCEALLLRYPRAASTETRGIAQRRAPVCSLVRAGAAVHSATPPGASVPVVVALEATEALRAAASMQPGALCLLCDLCIPPSTHQPGALRSAAEVRALLEQRGVQVVTVPVQQWLAEQRCSDALTSSVAFGAVARLLDLPLPACEALLERRTPASRLQENLAAFRWGAAQLSAAPQRAPREAQAGSPRASAAAAAATAATAAVPPLALNAA
jgi:indolepyruvate ferredoxin oxidoreductase, beta subunit